MAGLELYAPRTSRHRRTWTAAAIVLVFLFFVLGQVISIFGVLKPMGYKSSDLDTRWDALCMLLVCFAFASLLLILWVTLFERRSLSTIGFSGNGWLRYIKGYAVGLGFLGSVVGIIALLGGYQVQAAGVWQAPSLALCFPLLALFAGFIIQSATEEMMMRGWLMQVITSRHGLAWGMGVSSLIFGVLHASNIKPSWDLVMGLTNIVLFALFIGLYALKEGAIWGACGWHAAWNWLLGVGFGLEVSGQVIDVKPLIVDLAANTQTAWWLTGGKFGPEGSAVTSAVLTLGIIVMIAKGALKSVKAHGTPTAQPAE